MFRILVGGIAVWVVILFDFLISDGECDLFGDG